MWPTMQGGTEQRDAGTKATAVILDEILLHKRSQVALAMQTRSLNAIRSLAYLQPSARSFASRLRSRPGQPARLIAEIKRRSPSAGAMATIADPAELAQLYEANGARAISTLTDEKFFGGSLADLRAVSNAVSIPVLRKDFLFCEYQVWEARAAGADAILLIVAALASPLGDPEIGALHTVEPQRGQGHGGTDAPSGDTGAHSEREEQSSPDYAVARDRLQRLLRVARTVGLECLVEVHNIDEAAVAVDLRVPVLGINNRNLQTFTTSLETTEIVIRSLRHHPDYAPIIVSESGLHDLDAVERVRLAGAQAILVGEALVRSGNPATKVRAMAGEVVG